MRRHLWMLPAAALLLLAACAWPLPKPCDAHPPAVCPMDCPDDDESDDEGRG